MANFRSNEQLDLYSTLDDTLEGGTSTLASAFISRLDAAHHTNNGSDGGSDGGSGNENDNENDGPGRPSFSYHSKAHYHQYLYLKELVRDHMAAGNDPLLHETAHPVGGVQWNPDNQERGGVPDLGGGA